jgi:hypothetical protein
VDKGDTLILEIYNSSSEEWEEEGKGKESKLTDKKSKWKHEWAVDLTLNKNWAGHGKYRFYPEKKEKYASQVYYGPEIKMPSWSEWKEEIGFSDKVLEEPTITCTVNPPDEEKWFKKFTYTAKINHPDKVNMTVVLFVYKPGSDEWKPVPWRGDRFNPIINPSKYLFSIDAVQIEEDLNRYSISEDLKKGFKTKGFILSENATIKKEKADEWEITSGEKIYIVKKEGRKLNIYSSDYDKKGNATVGWAVEKREVFDEEDAGKSSKFHIWYWDGWNEYNESKGYANGPTLLVNREPEFKGLLKLAPDPGSTHCIYEYKFEVNDSDGDTVQGLLTVIDPLIEEHIIEGLYKEGNLTFRVGPDLGIFTDLGEYKNFTSSYRLEYWDEGMMVDGETNQEPKDGWFTGPTVTEVIVKNTTPVVSPNRGTYADEFEYRIKFYSSKDNTISLNLTIYDPSNRSKPWPAGVIDLKVLADKEEPAIWKIKPEAFGPDDFGKTARYTIEYEDSFGNRKILNGSGPSIERAVPVLSWDPPLVPIIPMVMVPFFTFVASLFLRYNLIGRLRRWREEKK